MLLFLNQIGSVWTMNYGSAWTMNYEYIITGSITVDSATNKWKISATSARLSKPGTKQLTLRDSSNIRPVNGKQINK